MPKTATRECGVENAAPEPPAAATTSKSAGKESPISTHALSLRRQRKVEGLKGEQEKSLRRLIDTKSTAGVGKKLFTCDTSSPRERDDGAAQRASASIATAATPTAASSSGAGSIVRRASASNATASMPASSSSTGFFGSFDDSRYWDYAFRFTQRQDIGNKCRECKRPFLALNEEIVVRRGGRIELRYHKDCFSMIADPRSQPSSSANVGKFVESLKGTVAPEELYQKMRTRGHW